MPDKTSEQYFLYFLMAALEDEHGINEEAWNRLIELCFYLYGPDIPSDIESVIRQVKATDGRYYLPEPIENEVG